MTPIEQINWDRQVKSGEMSFGALKAELAATRERADKAELAWAEGRKSLNAAIRESLAARGSEKWWRAKANQSSLSANRLGTELEASQASLAEQLAARKVDAEEIERLSKQHLDSMDQLEDCGEEIGRLKRAFEETNTDLIEQRRENSKLCVSISNVYNEISRLKKRVNTLIRKAKG